MQISALAVSGNFFLPPPIKKESAFYLHNFLPLHLKCTKIYVQKSYLR
jgi:hypothetical protein